MAVPSFLEINNQKAQQSKMKDVVRCIKSIEYETAHGGGSDANEEVSSLQAAGAQMATKASTSNNGSWTLEWQRNNDIY